MINSHEWADGFIRMFGLYDVDFQTKARTLRHSATVFKHIIEMKDAT